MDLEEIKALLDLLKDTDVTDLSVERQGTKIRIKREKLLTSIELPTAAVRMPHHAYPHAEKAPPAEAQTMADSRAEEDNQRLMTITAPLVGTFYNSPSPDAPSFVNVGDRVKKGKVICIVEAMKLMNEIEAEVDGIIVKCLVDNGQPVEYGEPLFLVEPL